MSKICRAGNRVIFDDEGSYIEDKSTGEIMWLEQRDGLYVLPAVFAPPGWKPQDGGPDNHGFAWPVR